MGICSPRSKMTTRRSRPASWRLWADPEPSAGAIPVANREQLSLAGPAWHTRAMDLSSITEIFGLIRNALGLARDAKDLLPAHQQNPIEEALYKAELVAATAEAKLAVELGYRLCRCTWPPQIRTVLTRPTGLISATYEDWW